MTPAEVERTLTSCDRVLSQVLEKITPESQETLLKELDEYLWDPDNSCRDFQAALMK